jgi:hypothetical protein
MILAQGDIITREEKMHFTFALWPFQAARQHLGNISGHWQWLNGVLIT